MPIAQNLPHNQFLTLSDEDIQKITNQIKKYQNFIPLTQENDLHEWDSLESICQIFRGITHQDIIGFNVTYEGLTIFQNEASNEITGYSAIDRCNWKKDENLNIIHPEDRLRVLQEYKQHQHRDYEDNLFHYQYRIISKQGKIKWIDDYSRQIPFKGDRAWLSFIIDISPQKKLQNQVLRQKKAKALYNLAAGLAHDFNNLLMVIEGNTSLAQHLVVPEQQEMSLLLDKIMHACQQATHLTQELADFSSEQQLRCQKCDLEKLLFRLVNLFIKPERISVDFNVSDNFPNIEVDIGKISSVFQNLLINAKQAMPNKGKIIINLKKVLDHEYNSKPFLQLERDYVSVQINDSGIGIPEDHLEKIFDPYFTTKSEGTGLGLVIVQKIITQHEGFIFVDSQIDKGTHFTIYLPVFLKKNIID